MNPDSLLHVAGRFQIRGRPTECQPFGAGHIHDTYFIVTDATAAYLLQRINHHVFRDVHGLMSNFERVTGHIRAKLSRMPGHDPDREVLTLIPDAAGHTFMGDAGTGYWRMLLFIPESRSYDLPDNPGTIEQAGRAFGRFLRMLADLPGPRLHETIPAFHNLKHRLEQFHEAVRLDPAGRVRQVRDEIRWVGARTEYMLTIHRMRSEGRLPERIAHHDTKLNNVLFNADGRAFCVVDLDTVMPGIAHSDFGDTIRTGASTAAEDEADLSRVSMDLRMFEAYARGYLDETRTLLAPSEKETLVLAGPLMTFMQGVRFLTDHINGDRYYKIHYPDHNAQRTRAQFRLVEDMEAKKSDMDKIMKACLR